jgi:hypothetical protein
MSSGVYGALEEKLEVWDGLSQSSPTFPVALDMGEFWPFVIDISLVIFLVRQARSDKL